MIPDAAAEQDSVARPGQITGDVHSFRHHTDTGGGDKHSVALAPLHHLGVPGHHRHPGGVGSPGHADNDALQVGQGQTLFQDKTRREIERPGAGHGHIVYGPVHRQRTDVSAGKKQRRDHMAVGTHHHASGRYIERSLVVALPQQIVIQVFYE